MTGKPLVATRSLRACSAALPKTCLKSSGLWTRSNSCGLILYCPSLFSHLGTIPPSPEVKGFQVFKRFSFPSRRYRGEEITSGFTPLAASQLAAEELPGRRASCCRSCCFPLGLRAVWGWWRWLEDRGGSGRQASG